MIRQKWLLLCQFFLLHLWLCLAWNTLQLHLSFARENVLWMLKYIRLVQFLLDFVGFLLVMFICCQMHLILNCYQIIHLSLKKRRMLRRTCMIFFSFCCRFCRLSCNVDVSPRIKTATENWCFSKHYMAMFIISNSLEELSFFSPRLAFIWTPTIARMLKQS